MKHYVMLFLLLLPLPSFAVSDNYQFDTPAQQQQFQQLILELRCLVCQNQNLADSNAPLAKDLRQEVYNMTMAGQSRQQIIDFLVQRYGDFVLYKPPFKWNTYALWLGPLLFVIIGFSLALLIWRRRSRDTQQALTDAEKEKLNHLLNEFDNRS